MKKISPGLGCLFLFLIIGCGPIKPLTISEIEHVRLVELKGSAALIEASFKVQNPNSFGFSVKASDMDVLLDNAFVGKARIMKKVKIKRNSDQLYTVQVEANMAQFFLNGLMNMMGSKSKSKVRLKGDLKVSKFGFINKKIPVDVEKSIDLSKYF
jgi:LEA14-like dessication related protein